MSPASAASSRSSSARRRATVSRRARAAASWWASSWPCSRHCASALRRSASTALARSCAACASPIARWIAATSSPAAFASAFAASAALLGLGPAGVEQPRLDRADLLGQLAIAFGRPRLAAQLGRALLLVGQDFAEPREIGFGRAQFLLGILAPRVKAGNARRFLEQQPALDRLGGDDRADLALADERRRMGAGRGIGEQQRRRLSRERRGRRSDRPSPPPRSIRRVTSLSLRSTSSPASRSSRIETSAKSRGGRVAVPAKITSSMPPPRSSWGWIRPSPSGSLRAGSTCRSRSARRPRSAPARCAARPARRSS